ncbi:MAG: sulfotransferase domain-containing protein [Bacteroidales bacterium]
MIKKNILYLHIGYPKTGTTTLQKYLFPKHSNIQSLQRNGEPGFIKNIFTCRENSIKRNLKAIANELSRHVSDEYDNYIYSSESLTSFSMFFRQNPYPYIYTLDPNSTARKLKTAFLESGIFDDVKIIVTIRRQDDLLKSMYAQIYNLVYKRFRVTNTFQKFINYAIENKDNFILDALQYNDVITEYENIFGENNICVLAFEQFKQDRTAYLDKLCSFMSIDSEEAITLLNDKHINRKSSANGYKTDKRDLLRLFQNYLRWLNIKSPGIGLSKSLLFKPLKNIKAPAKTLKKLKIKEADEKFLKDFFSEGNIRLSQRHHLALENYNYYIIKKIHNENY